MTFAKMHGAGNDFVVVNGYVEQLDEQTLGKLAAGICHRNFGVGGDGLILMLPSEHADFRMRMFNPDGSEAEMCGNGIRCAAKFAYEHGITKSNPVRVETLAGVMNLDLRVKARCAIAARVDMGKPRLLRSEIPMLGSGDGPVVAESLSVAGREYAVTCV